MIHMIHSADAGTEVALLKQGDLSVEAYAATIISTNLRIIVCSPFATTALAGYFIAGIGK